MNEFSSQRYSREDVDRIMRRALKLDNEDRISYRDLIATAGEIGLDPKIIDAAIEQEHRDFQNKKIRMAQLKRRKAGFYSHFSSYLIVNAALLFINHFTPGPWWFQWPLLGWGIGVAFHFKAAYFPANNRLRIARKPKCGFARSMMCG